MSDRWTRLQELVEAASELGPDERAAFLETQAGHDPALRDEAAELLVAGLGNNDFLDPLVGDAPIKVGSTLGPFRIVRPLARGGMGMVFEATQESPSRRVALKVMRSDLITPASRSRFRYEIEALGALSHPGVAQIYQAGLQGTLPWFAMEYVEGGRPITNYCTEEQLDRRARISLVADVADTVHHGHIKGVLHRDLKPDNLLVDAAGRTRVIDFGIARLVDTEQRMTTMQTESQSIVGTLAYMSPEQVRGGSGDVRSDVYSLGGVLYELLTGKLPIEVDTSDFLTSARRIVEDPARRPASLDVTLKGDLEAILLKTLEKDPERRYASAAAFGEELGRFLRHEPVEARTPGAWDRARAFARRNRVLVGAAAAVLAVSIAAAVISISFAMTSRSAESLAVAKSSEARGERDRANELLTQSLKRSLDTTFAAVPRIHSLPGGAEAAEHVMERTVKDLEVLDEQSGGDPRVRLALAEAVAKLGDILGNPRFANRGDAKGAQAAYDRVLEILGTLDGEGRRSRDRTFLRACVMRRKVELRGRRPDAPNAIEELEQVRMLLAPLVAANPDDARAQGEFAIASRNQSWEFMRRGEHARALERIGEAIRGFETAKRLEPKLERNTEFLASSLAQQARIQAREGLLVEAARSYDRTIALLEPLATTPERVSNTALGGYWVERAALASQQKDFARAEALIIKAKDHAVAQCRGDPKNNRHRFAACMALMEWIRIAEGTHGATEDGKPPREARERARTALLIIEELVEGTSSKMAQMFGGQLRDYAEGKLDAGSLMGATGR